MVFENLHLTKGLIFELVLGFGSQHRDRMIPLLPVDIHPIGLPDVLILRVAPWAFFFGDLLEPFKQNRRVDMVDDLKIEDDLSIGGSDLVI